MSNKPIACDLYDYVEIACLYRLQVRLHLKDGSEILGQASTTSTGADKTEFIEIQRESNVIQVPLHELTQMDAVTPNRHFERIEF